MKWLKEGSYIATIVASIATLVAAIIAIFAFLSGINQFRETQVAQREAIRLQREALEFERESKTVELFNEYAKLMREEAARMPGEGSKTNPWIGSTVLFLAETIYKFNDGWHDTVKIMLQNQREFITTVRLHCHTYVNSFIIFTKNAVGTEDICRTE